MVVEEEKHITRRKQPLDLNCSLHFNEDGDDDGDNNNGGDDDVPYNCGL